MILALSHNMNPFYHLLLSDPMSLSRKLVLSEELNLSAYVVLFPIVNLSALMGLSQGVNLSRFLVLYWVMNHLIAQSVRLSSWAGLFHVHGLIWLLGMALVPAFRFPIDTTP